MYVVRLKSNWHCTACAKNCCFLIPGKCDDSESFSPPNPWDNRGQRSTDAVVRTAFINCLPTSDSPRFSLERMACMVGGRKKKTWLWLTRWLFLNCATQLTADQPRQLTNPEGITFEGNYKCLRMTVPLIVYTPSPVKPSANSAVSSVQKHVPIIQLDRLCRVPRVS